MSVDLPHPESNQTPNQGHEAAQGELRFEQAVSELERVVQQLSQPNVSLDDAVALYERGVNLARRGRELISQAETRVDALRQSLTQAQGGPSSDSMSGDVNASRA